MSEMSFRDRLGHNVLVATRWLQHAVYGLFPDSSTPVGTVGDMRAYDREEYDRLCSLAAEKGPWHLFWHEGISYGVARELRREALCVMRLLCIRRFRNANILSFLEKSLSKKIIFRR